MNITVNSAIMLTVMLMFIRFSAVFALTPLFAFGNPPVTFRVLWLMGLTMVVFVGLNITPVEIGTTQAFIQAAVMELLLGALMGFGLFCAFAAFQLGGRVLDFQMGFGVANLIDPVTRAPSPMIGTVLNFIGVIIFFLVDGHHMLIRGLSFSFEQVPVGQGLDPWRLDAVVAQFGLMFVYGVIVVAPAMILLLLLDVAMAVAARTMPQVNMFILGIPLKIFLGLMMVALSLDYLSPLLGKIYQSIFTYWEQLLGS